MKKKNHVQGGLLTSSTLLVPAIAEKLDTGQVVTTFKTVACFQPVFMETKIMLNHVKFIKRQNRGWCDGIYFLPHLPRHQPTASIFGEKVGFSHNDRNW